MRMSARGPFVSAGGYRRLKNAAYGKIVYVFADIGRKKNEKSHRTGKRQTNRGAEFRGHPRHRRNGRASDDPCPSGAVSVVVAFGSLLCTAVRIIGRGGISARCTRFSRTAAGDARGGSKITPASRAHRPGFIPPRARARRRPEVILYSSRIVDT